METRREFLRKLIVTGEMLTFNTRTSSSDKPPMREKTENASQTLYRAVNGTPVQNIAKIIDMMGGIQNIIGFDDIVVIKPNVQWWNQGAPNLAVLKTFVDLIMERLGGFNGEVIVAENCHRGSSPWQHGGWSNVFKWNSDLPRVSNMNELSKILKEKYGSVFQLPPDRRRRGE
jgi:hypothetical protein